MIRKLAIGFLSFAATQASAQTAGGPNVDLAGLLLSLAAVLALIVGAAFVLKRTPLGSAARGNGALKVVATLALGPKERLLLVDVHGVEMLVATGPGGVAVVPAGGPAERQFNGLSRQANANGERPIEPTFSLGDAG